MKKPFVNKALEELILVKEAVKLDTIEVLHCSQFNAYKYLHDSGCYGVVNNKQMMRMFRFALAAYVNSLWVGCAIVFLDVVHSNNAYIMGINGESIDIQVELLKKVDEVCRIMAFSSMQLSKNIKHTVVIGAFNKNRLPDESFRLEKGSLFRRF